MRRDFTEEILTSNSCCAAYHIRNDVIFVREINVGFYTLLCDEVFQIDGAVCFYLKESYVYLRTFVLFFQISKGED